MTFLNEDDNPNVEVQLNPVSTGLAIAEVPDNSLPAVVLDLLDERGIVVRLAFQHIGGINTFIAAVEDAAQLQTMIDDEGVEKAVAYMEQRYAQELEAFRTFGE